MSKEKSLSFEDSLAQLEALVNRMESGELTLEESLKSFEEGVALTRNCQQALSEAEQKIEILTSNSTDAAPEPFDSDV